MNKLINTIDAFLDKFLPDKVMKFIRNFLNMQFITFVLIGVVNTLSTTVITLTLNFITDSLFSSNAEILDAISKLNINFVIGYILSVVLSFFLNCRFTFKEKPTLKKFVKFPISYIPNFLIQYIFVLIFRAIGLPTAAAYVSAAIIGIPVTFLTMKIVVFAKGKR